MTDSFVQVPPDDTGKKLDAEQLTVGANTVQRERMQVTGAAADDVSVVTDTDPAATVHGLVTREVGPVSPQTSTASVATVVPDATGSVDSTQITSGKTGKLFAFDASGSVPFKVELQSVLNGVATTRLVRFGRSGDVSWRAPHKEFITQAESATAGFDGFRLLFTNLDTGSVGSDFYGNFLWDEV